MKWLASLCGVLCLAGCGDPSLETLDATLTELRHSTHVRTTDTSEKGIEPFPTASAEAYRYPIGRSPFQSPQATVGQQPAVAEDTLVPRTPRPREPLEHFALAELRLVGTLTMGRQRVALIETPEGRVVSAQVGAYLGGDEGRITQITTQEVRIAEHVDTPQGRQARTASLALDAPH